MSLVVKEPGNVLEKGQKIPFKFCYVFDYSVGQIYRFEIPRNVVNNFQLEEYMEEELGLKLDNIEYMTTSKITRIKILDAKVFVKLPKSFKK